jgi:hypothetical protein
MHAAAALDHGTAPQFFRNALRVMMVLGLLTVAISVAGRMAGGVLSHGGNSDSTRKHEIVIANSVFSVPENHIRLAEQRSQGVKARLDLFAVWPGMNGYTQAGRTAFDALPGQPPSLLFISIEPRQMSRDMSGRLQPIYSQLIEAEAVEGPVSGMRSYAFRADRAIFSDERLYVAGAASSPDFVARCIAGAQAEHALAPCERDIAIGDDLTVKYRFPARLLAEHVVLDAKMRAFVQSLAVEQAK